LNLRTIQRLESGAKISNESLRALAAVFEVSAERQRSRSRRPRASLRQRHPDEPIGGRYVPRTLQPVFQNAVGEVVYANDDAKRAKFEAVVAFGKRQEPWMIRASKGAADQLGR
jgi:hypothetical protein